jgi:tetratricopeptide (TPR) repeat protein
MRSTLMKPSTKLVCVLAGLACLPTLGGCKKMREAREARRMQAVTISRESAQQTYDRAQRLADQGLPEVALDELTRLIERNPRMTIAYIAVGDIHTKAGDYVKAEPPYGKAAQLEPRNFDAQYKHGLVLQLLNRVGEAVRAYLRALSIRPEDYDANLNIATAYLQLGEANQAVSYGERAVRLRPDAAPARVNLAAIYSSLGREDEAIVEYQQASELMELTPDLLLNMAASYGRLQRYPEMQSTLEQLIRIKPSPAAHERLGFALFRQGQYPQAVDNFRAAIRMEENYFPALNGFGVCRLNDFLTSNRSNTTAKEEGLTALRRSLQIEPNQPSVKELVSRYGR